MHARVVTLKVTSETAAEAVRRYDESIENSKRTPGYKMGILLTNPDTGKGFSITIWETKEQVIERNTDGYYAQQMKTMGDVWAEPPILEDYEVSVYYNHDL